MSQAIEVGPFRPRPDQVRKAFAAVATFYSAEKLQDTRKKVILIIIPLFVIVMPLLLNIFNIELAVSIGFLIGFLFAGSYAEWAQRRYGPIVIDRTLEAPLYGELGVFTADPGSGVSLEQANARADVSWSAVTGILEFRHGTIITTGPYLFIVTDEALPANLDRTEFISALDVMRRSYEIQGPRSR